MTTLEPARRRRARANRAAAAWALLLLAATALSWRFPSTAIDTGRFVAASMIDIAPVIAVAVALTAAIAATGSGTHLRRVFAGRWLATIVAASAIGAVTPICGVGVLPLIAGLLGAGVPLAPVMALVPVFRSRRSWPSGCPRRSPTRRCWRSPPARSAYPLPSPRP